MNYKMFRMLFNTMFVCLDFPDDWSAVRFNSKWEADCAFGKPVMKAPEKFVDFAKNPQFMIDNTINGGIEELELFISLAQEDGRGQMVDGKPSKFPFGEAISKVLFVVFKLPAG